MVKRQSVREAYMQTLEQYLNEVPMPEEKRQLFEQWRLQVRAMGDKEFKKIAREAATYLQALDKQRTPESPA